MNVERDDPYDPIEDVYFKDRTGDITIHIEKCVINTYKNKLK